jgi:hypothetical protein
MAARSIQWQTADNIFDLDFGFRLLDSPSDRQESTRWFPEIPIGP